jgi:Zn-finger nucleic acid-binding protein
VAETLLDECPKCGGLWIDQAAFERVTKESQSQQSALQALGSLPPRRGKLTAEARKVVYLRCPDCDTVMNRRNYARRSGIIIDVCAAHGIWFDRDELTRVIEFVRRGGLEESKRRDLEELRRETARAEAARLSAGQRSGFFGNEGLFAESDKSPILGLFRVLSEIIE